MVEHFRFLKARTKRTPKMTIPSPSSLHFRYGRDAVPERIYPSMDDFYRDLGKSYRKVVRAFADAGCRYLQLDEVNLAYLCDPSLRQVISDRGEDPATLPATYARMINAAISDIPSDMTITMHLCRGNFRSNFVASGLPRVTPQQRWHMSAKWCRARFLFTRSGAAHFHELISQSNGANSAT